MSFLYRSIKKNLLINRHKMPFEKCKTKIGDELCICQLECEMDYLLRRIQKGDDVIVYWMLRNYIKNVENIKSKDPKIIKLLKTAKQILEKSKEINKKYFKEENEKKEKIKQEELDKCMENYMYWILLKINNNKNDFFGNKVDSIEEMLRYYIYELLKYETKNPDRIKEKEKTLKELNKWFICVNGERIFNKKRYDELYKKKYSFFGF